MRRDRLAAASACLLPLAATTACSPNAFLGALKKGEGPTMKGGAVVVATPTSVHLQGNRGTHVARAVFAAAAASTALRAAGIRSARGSQGWQLRRGGRPSLPSQRRAADAVPELWKAGPAEVYSGQAQKALYLLKENPLLFEATVEEELETLRVQKEEEEEKRKELDEAAKKDTLVLRRRIEEVRANERVRIVTELLYLKVCQKFLTMQVPLIPTLKDGGSFKFGAVDLKGLTEEIYSKDALDLVREHLFKIIGTQGNTSFFGTGVAMVQIALFQAGQVYAMSALFGYYLRRVDARFQLEKLAGSFGAWGEASSDESKNPFGKDQEAAKSLKEYVQNFGPDEMAHMTAIASVEARMAMESQVSALFGDLSALRDKIHNALGMVSSSEEATSKLEQAIQRNEVESLKLTSDDLRRLVLEAVAYGAVLNDSEKQFDSIYELTPSSRPPLFTDDNEGRYLNE